ncbi:hypothetical protein XH99_01710 [Bradyrhizobium nanningense]|uniref:Uncharacterized protein n=1 Tax=Bradyrhizobium nanningense TaxID=1325118 RepID=A0A4Q0SIB4_9BRAD|nr:hypothetical protein [Bradyrhizobium nanningense]RXH38009.1 hypothetical protein XH99_01710 [Bradyrhizobium nanningense]
MNVDPRNATDNSFEIQQPHHVGQQQDELSVQTSVPTSSEIQESFEQQLNDLAPDESVSLHLTVESPSAIAAPSSAPNQAASEPSRCPASSFVSARAQLAATLTGATLEALRSEIELAEQKALRWSSPTEAAIDRDRVFDDVAGSSYVTLRRFQNQDTDCKPHAEESTSAISHVRNTARDLSSIGDPLERYPMDRARQAGWHMRGKTTASPFVSMVEDPSKLTVSRDHWARAIANNANTLHTYAVPKSAVWTPDDVLSSIAIGMNAGDQDNVDADLELMCSMGRTPTQETERLFLGGNLDSYRIARQENPYKRKSGEE